MQPAQSSPDVSLFRHQKRRHWGIAALLWERDGKRGYQFSDGKMRVFKEGFYHLLAEAEAPGDGSARAVRRLARVARANDVTESTRLPTLRDQISLFRRSFPDGFRGEAWSKAHRGVEASKRLKRHRDPAISEAHALSAEQLQPLIDAGDHDTVLERVRELAASSNLIPGSHAKKLARIRPSRELSLAIQQWVACAPDDDEAERSFNVLVRKLGDAATWPLVTAIAGLVDPEHHTCVRPSVYTQQGKMLLPNFQADKRPRFAVYRRYLHMARTIEDELGEAGFSPRDLLDIYDFVWETLRPAVRDELVRQYELPPPAASTEAEADTADVQAA